MGKGARSNGRQRTIAPKPISDHPFQSELSLVPFCFSILLTMAFGETSKVALLAHKRFISPSKVIGTAESDMQSTDAKCDLQRRQANILTIESRANLTHHPMQGVPETTESIAAKQWSLTKPQTHLIQRTANHPRLRKEISDANRVWRLYLRYCVLSTSF